MTPRPCSDCRTARFRFSHRSVPERLVGLIWPVRPYRCQRCRRRYWTWSRRLLEPGRFAVWFVLAWSVAGLIIQA